jgi:phosphomethylpyrimidine synthase
MKITQDVRDYAAAQGLEASEVVADGMAQKSAEFRKAGGELYIPIKPQA